MTMLLFFRIIWKILRHERPRTHNAHIPYQNIDKLWQFVKRSTPKYPSILIQTHIIRQKLSVLVLAIVHSPKLYEFKDLLILTRSCLSKKRVAPHKDCTNINPTNHNKRNFLI